MIFGEKIKLEVCVNQHDFVSDIQTPSQSWFLHELLISSTTVARLLEVMSCSKRSPTSVGNWQENDSIHLPIQFISHQIQDYNTSDM
jgi:hypothetical protein